jgi:hypothetical protein
MSNHEAQSNVRSDYRHAFGYFRRRWRNLTALFAII